ncbi:uncharacterized protein JCM6883_000078 [Sporobolomyces salmoneus]|uniref:uncharacterized protein n=1 Tax=Sporobolomyces salmoneus TaxID=183962 RepID=UPI00317749A9
MSDSTEQPTQISSTLKSIQGQVYQAVGSVSSDPTWKEEGDELVEQAQKEIEEAKARAKGEAAADRTVGKVQSAYGMLTGNQEQQTQGNLKAEKGEMKSSLANGKLPIPSAERLEGKLESAVGMVTGDSEKQTQGNLKAEKAEWTKG